MNFKMNKKLKEALTVVYKEFKAIECLKKNAQFKCYSDDVLSYYFEKDNSMYEINIICDDTLLNEMPILDLLNLKRIGFFGCRFFIREDKDSEWHETFGVRYSTYDDSVLN